MSKIFDQKELNKTISKSPKSWKKSDIRKFLKFIGLLELADIFEENLIDGKKLLKMADEKNEFLDELEISKKNKTILRKCAKQLKQNIVEKESSDDDFDDEEEDKRSKKKKLNKNKKISNSESEDEKKKKREKKNSFSTSNSQKSSSSDKKKTKKKQCKNKNSSSSDEVEKSETSSIESSEKSSPELKKKINNKRKIQKSEPDSDSEKCKNIQSNDDEDKSSSSGSEKKKKKTPSPPTSDEDDSYNNFKTKRRSQPKNSGKKNKSESSSIDEKNSEPKSTNKKNFQKKQKNSSSSCSDKKNSSSGDEAHNNFQIIDSSSEDENEVKLKKKKLEEIKTKKKFSDDEEEFKNMTVKSVSKNKKKQEDEEEMTLKAKPKKKIPPLIKIVQILDNKERIFTEDFTINRNKEGGPNHICVNSKEISRKHAEFLLLENGFYLRDKGSVNSIYIKINKETNVLLQTFLEFRLGYSILKIDEINGKKIKLSISENICRDEDIEEKQCEIDLSKNEELIFPSKKFKRDFFNNDDEVKNDHVVFSVCKKNILLKPLIDSNVWMKLDNAKVPENNSLYLMSKDMQIRLGEIDSFVIKETFKDKFPLCKCKNIANSVVFPCNHIFACFQCVTGFKKCDKCGNSIKNKIKLIDISNFGGEI